jgi:hypothetical protein
MIADMMLSAQITAKGVDQGREPSEKLGHVDGIRLK